MLPTSHITSSLTELTSILQRLKIESLNEICTYSAKAIAEHFDAEQINILNNALRDYLWQAKLLPDRMKDLNQANLPIEVLGLAPHFQADLANDGVQTVTEFIQRDATEYLTSRWPARNRLAVRTRIFCLLSLTTEQVNRLKFFNTSTALVTSIDSIQVIENGEERQRAGRRFRVTTTGTQEVTDWLKESDELADCPFIHKPWLRNWLPDDVSPAYPEIVKFLFEDVCQLPIATSRHHEIWAGAQMKATEHLKKIVRNSDLIAPDFVFLEAYKHLNVSWRKLERLCINNQLVSPNFVLWIGEILTVRKDFYSTPRSRFRHFIKSIENSDCDQTIIENVISVAFDSFEMFWMLPDFALKFVRERGQELNDTLPAEEEFKDWLAVNAGLTKRELTTLLEQGLTARNKLVSNYFRSVLRFARNYVERFDDADYLDLVQEGAIGLIAAADKFDYRMPGRFIVYATNWMWQTTERAICDQLRNIRVPVHRHEQFKQLEQAYQKCLIDSLEIPQAKNLCLHLEFLNDEEKIKIQQHLQHKTDLPPKTKERWNKAIEKTQQLLEYIEPTLSLYTEIPADLIGYNFSIDDDIDTAYLLGEIIYDQRSSPNDIIAIQDIEDNITNEVLRNLILDFCDSLTPRQNQIIKLRYGLEDGKERTLEEIGQQFGLTRERIRQLEARAIKKLQHPVRKRILKEYVASGALQKSQWPDEIVDFICNNHSYWSKFDSFEFPPKEDWQWLDSLLEGLPGLGWHRREDGVSRKIQLEDALKALKSPAHYSNITEQLNDILGEELEEKAVYSLLHFNYGNNFVLLGEGVFSLIEWERRRCFEPEPLLPFCPLSLPDIPGQTDTFLESVLIAQEYLNQKPKTSDFLTYMLKWVGVEVTPSNWLKQSLLNAYYLVGLIPYTFHFAGDDPVLSSTLPSLELAELRYYCLQKLTARLLAMPEFWWTVRQYQPGTISNFAEHFAEIHPLELDDVGNRLKLLIGLGAIQRLPYNRYQLTAFGTSLAREWARQPDFSKLPPPEAVALKFCT